MAFLQVWNECKKVWNDEIFGIKWIHKLLKGLTDLWLDVRIWTNHSSRTGDLMSSNNNGKNNIMRHFPFHGVWSVCTITNTTRVFGLRLFKPQGGLQTEVWKLFSLAYSVDCSRQTLRVHSMKRSPDKWERKSMRNILCLSHVCSSWIYSSSYWKYGKHLHN